MAPAVNVDIEDILAGIFGSMLGRILLFMLAVWLGCSIGVTALVAGSMVQGGFDFGEYGYLLLVSPLLIFSLWGLLNIPFLLFSFIYFIRSEGTIYRAWGIVVGVESLAVMLGWTSSFVSGWLQVTAAWLAWVVLLVMLETGVWLIYQSQMNAWAQEIGMLRVANAQRRAEQEAKENARIALEKAADG